VTKHSKSWIELSVRTAAEGVEAVCARLEGLGISAFAIEPGADYIEKALSQSVKYWDFADIDSFASSDYCVKVYFTDTPESRSLVGRVREEMQELKALDTGLDLGPLHVTERILPEEDWANNWKKTFKPIEIGEKLLIHPAWEPFPKDTQRAVVTIDSGMAFGTGEHETTRMCLELIERLPVEGKRIVDLGCGSGILSLAALSLGASRATGIDIDPVATGVAADNAAKNGAAGGRFEILTGDILEDIPLYEKVAAKGPFDFAFANIVAGIIIPLTPLVLKILAPGGIYIVSGIITDRLDEVLAALKQAGFAIQSQLQRGDWHALAAKKLK